MSSIKKLKWYEVLGIIFLCIVLLYPVKMMYQGIQEYRSYIYYADRVVPVTAKITDMQELQDSDNEEYYELYVSYKYEDIDINNAYWMTTYSDDYKKGDVITIKVDPDNPKHILEHYEKIENQLTLGLAFFSITICALSWLMMNCMKKKNNGKCIITDVKICKNLMTWVFYPMSFLLSYGVAIVTEVVYARDLVNGSVGIISICLGLILFIYTLVNIITIPKRPYKLTLQKCINCYEKEYDDSDGGTSRIRFADFSNVKGVRCDADVGIEYYLVQNHKDKVKGCYNKYLFDLKLEDKSLKKGTLLLVFRMIFTELVCAGVTVFGIVLLNL